MDEYVSAAILRLNESIAFRRVEPFHSASSHHGLLCPHKRRPHDHRAIAYPKSALPIGRHTVRCATKQGQARISRLYAVLARGSKVPCDWSAPLIVDSF